MRFMADKGAELSPNALITVGFLYFVIWKDVRKRFSGLSSYVKRFLAIQNARRKATQELAGSIRALCRQVTDKENCSDCSQCREERL